MKVIQGVAYQEIKIEDVKDVKVKVNLNFVYCDWYGTCDPPGIRECIQMDNFQKACRMVLEKHYPKGCVPSAMS